MSRLEIELRISLLSCLPFKLVNVWLLSNSVFNSLIVSNIPVSNPVILLIAFCTNLVVASWSLLVSSEAVGAVGTPFKLGDVNFA